MKIEETKDQMHAYIFYKYIEFFNLFETRLKKIFINAFIEFPDEIKQRLFFYIGGIKGSIDMIDYDTYTLKTNYKEYTGTKLLNDLSLIQMIKISRKDRLLKGFNEGIEAIQTKTNFDLYDACINIINARNILAHQCPTTVIKDKDTVELLSNDNYEKVKIDWINVSDYEILEENDKRLICNYIYMNRIIDLFPDS